MHAFKRARLLAILAATALAILGLAVLATPAGAAEWVTATVTGTVTDTSGNPVPNCTVIMAQQMASGGWHMGVEDVQTDGNGNYTINHTWWDEDYNPSFTICYGEYSNGMWRPQWYGAVPWVDYITREDQAAQRAGHFALAQGSNLTLPNVQIKRYQGTITGRVTDSKGTPLTGVRVRAYLRTSGEQQAWNPSEDFYTKADGRYRIDVPPCIRPQINTYAVLYEKTDVGLWQSEWYNNVPAQDEWQGSTLFTLYRQAMWPELYAIAVDSEQTFTADAVLGPKIKDSAKVVSITPSKPKAGKSFTVKLRVSPGHTVAPKVQVQFYKYNSGKRRYVAFGKPKTAALIVQRPGSADFQLKAKLSQKGKYRAVAIVNKHWSGAHARRVSPAKTFTVR